MKYTIFENEEGHKERRIIRNSDTPSMAEFGIPAGPPNLKRLNIEDLLREINHNLVANELFTWDDVQRSNGKINAAVNIFRRKLIALYRKEHRDRNERS